MVNPVLYRGNRLIGIFLLSLLCACSGGSSSESEIIPVVSASPPPPDLGGSTAPDSPAAPVEPSANSSTAETTTQTDINASVSQQNASSLNFNVLSIVDTALPDTMSSESFEAVATIHLIFKQG